MHIAHATINRDLSNSKTEASSDANKPEKSKNIKVRIIFIVLSPTLTVCAMRTAFWINLVFAQ